LISKDCIDPDTSLRWQGRQVSLLQYNTQAKHGKHMRV
jgi:hypothetical protein